MIIKKEDIDKYRAEANGDPEKLREIDGYERIFKFEEFMKTGKFEEVIQVFKRASKLSKI